ncbi:hypothetical protein, partial [Salmonella sp. s51228]|uniref:hypothetical protein n=1 Tax=Salmonella sp. s51228 TaxID=3159652 RepID=UPI00397EA6FB
MAKETKHAFQLIKESVDAAKDISHFGKDAARVIGEAEHVLYKDSYTEHITIDFEKIIEDHKGLSGLENLEKIGIHLPKIDFKLVIPTYKALYEARLEAAYQLNKNKELIEKNESNFTNWAQTVDLKVNRCYPRNVQSIKDIIKNKDYTEKKIALAASTHSWPNLFGKNNSLLIDFTLFNSIGSNILERVKVVDEKKGIVDISAGCSILQKHC